MLFVTWETETHVENIVSRIFIYNCNRHLAKRKQFAEVFFFVCNVFVDDGILADAQDPIPCPLCRPLIHKDSMGHAQTLGSAAIGTRCRHLQQCRNCHKCPPKKEEPTNMYQHRGLLQDSGRTQLHLKAIRFSKP